VRSDATPRGIGPSPVVTSMVREFGRKSGIEGTNGRLGPRRQSIVEYRSNVEVSRRSVYYAPPNQIDTFRATSRPRTGTDNPDTFRPIPCPHILQLSGGIYQFSGLGKQLGPERHRGENTFNATVCDRRCGLEKRRREKRNGPPVRSRQRDVPDEASDGRSRGGHYGRRLCRISPDRSFCRGYRSERGGPSRIAEPTVQRPA